ncbi:MAG: hypothetical protein VYB54_07445 [Pseudomonadota bacterium]|nr:hypothetical protein [Pseudomonadota bacterium]
MSLPVGEEVNGTIKLSTPVAAISGITALTVIGSIIAGIMWFRDPVEQNTRDIVELRGRIAVIEAKGDARDQRLESAERSRAADMASIREALRRIEDKLDRKVDKGGHQ